MNDHGTLRRRRESGGNAFGSETVSETVCISQLDTLSGTRGTWWKIVGYLVFAVGMEGCSVPRVVLDEQSGVSQKVPRHGFAMVIQRSS